MAVRGDIASINEEFVKTCFVDQTDCTSDRVFITDNFIRAAGIKPDDFNNNPEYGKTAYFVAKKWNRVFTSRMYINPETGKSCVTLITKDEGNTNDFPARAIVCGGACQKDNNKIKTYCKPIPPK